MEEVIGKSKLVNNSLPKHLILNNRKIFDKKAIVNSFNNILSIYLKWSDSSFEELTLSDEEIRTAFFSFRGGKSPGFGQINYDI